jgi:apolipoprotein N-acyltransferase
VKRAPSYHPETKDDVSRAQRSIVMPLVLAVLASAAMWFASTGVNHVWPLAWLAPVPLLVVLPELGIVRAAGVAFIASLLAALNLVIAYPTLPKAVLVSALLAIAGQTTLVLLAWRLVARRAGPVAATLAYPSLLVAMEFLVSRTGPHGTFGSLGYTQADVLPVMQLASVTGVFGVSFLVALAGAALAIAWRRRREPSARNLVLATGLAPLLASLVFGVTRLERAPAMREMPIGLLADDTRVRYFRASDSAQALPFIRRYAERVGQLAARGARVVVLPEKFVGVLPEYDGAARQLFADAARQHHVTLVAGINLQGDAESRNLALVYDPGGREVVEYDKRHPVPGLEEGYRLGQGPALLPDPAGAMGVAICKDMDFAPLGREYAAAGAGLLLVPAWDFTTDRWIHSRMAVARGIEGGFAVARSAAQGLLTLSDPYGRVVAEVPSSAADAPLVAALPVGWGGTWYSRGGDWFAWGTIALSFLLLTRAIVGRAGGRWL